MTKKCLKTRYFVIDESKKIEGCVSGFPNKKEAEKEKSELIRTRSKRSEQKYNREFRRSKNLHVVKCQIEVKC